ncbi:NADPH-dependent FMN reductase [Jatrophihabitans sp.]|jgi:NAD(P)H-dependent FMN reductase|uniref:NADPH-dependent FMN reductase n=1 Tax=Jatrophihabitans sp. TaxID=1932789 RepID=UPI002EFBE699
MRSLLLICGSVRPGSTNAAVLRTAGLLAAEDVAVTSYDELASLPHFNPDDDTDSRPAAVVRLRAQLAEAGALLFCTPEYAGALPGSFKNLLDWSVGGGEMSGKPVGWINCSWGPTGAAGAYAELRTVLTYTDSVIVEPGCAQVPVTRADVGADGLVHDPAIRARLADVVTALAAALS